MVLSCLCENDKNGNSNAAYYQDTLYGYKQRVHNRKPKKPKMPVVYRCTICSREREK